MNIYICIHDKISKLIYIYITNIYIYIHTYTFLFARRYIHHILPYITIYMNMYIFFYTCGFNLA